MMCGQYLHTAYQNNVLLAQQSHHRHDVGPWRGKEVKNDFETVSPRVQRL